MTRKMKQALRGLRFRRVEMGLFDFSVDIVIGDAKLADRVMAVKYPDPRPIGDARGMCFSRIGFTPAIWLPQPPVTPRHFGTASHEAAHAAIHLMVWAGVKIDEDDDETLCHAIGWIMTNIVECGKQRVER